jgi:hypothetical protein
MMDFIAGLLGSIFGASLVDKRKTIWARCIVICILTNAPPLFVGLLIAPHRVIEGLMYTGLVSLILCVILLLGSKFDRS